MIGSNRDGARMLPLTWVLIVVYAVFFALIRRIVEGRR
jgi:hypothetical protein